MHYFLSKQTRYRWKYPRKKEGARNVRNVSYATRSNNTKSKSTWDQVIFVTFSICFMQMMQFSVFFALGFKIPLTFEPRLGTFQEASLFMVAAADTTCLAKVRSLTEDH